MSLAHINIGATIIARTAYTLQSSLQPIAAIGCMQRRTRGAFTILNRTLSTILCFAKKPYKLITSTSTFRVRSKYKLFINWSVINVKQTLC